MIVRYIAAMIEMIAGSSETNDPLEMITTIIDQETVVTVDVTVVTVDGTAVTADEKTKIVAEGDQVLARLVSLNAGICAIVCANDVPPAK